MNSEHAALIAFELMRRRQEYDPEKRVAIVQALSWQYVLRQLGYHHYRLSSGGKIDLLCIFHSEKTPSMRLWPDGEFLCHGCLARGDIFDLLWEHAEGRRIVELWAPRNPAQLSLDFAVETVLAEEPF